MTDTATAAAPGAAVPREPVGEYSPPYLAAGLAALGVWLLYALTLAPTTGFWDTSEYIATAHIMGIPHPPGNPTFVVLARAWELLLAPFGLDVAVRINLFSATMGAAAHGFWFLMVHRIMAFFSTDPKVRMLGAIVAVIVSATAFTVWSQSNLNEKVYTVSLFTIALLSWLAFHWRDNLGKGKDDNLILLMIFILALSVGNHLMAFLAAPALVVFILLVEPRTLTNWKLYAFGAAVALLGLSIHLFLPLRASLGPIINEADPSTYGALLESLGRKQYDKPSIFSDPTDPGLPRSIGLVLAQIGNYIQYFDWQWARALNPMEPLFGGARSFGDFITGGALRPVVTIIFAALGIYGFYEHFDRDRISWWYAIILFATVSIGLVGYLNFRYGYTFPVPAGIQDAVELHEVRERDYFFIVSFSLWGLWSGIGIVALWQGMVDSAASKFEKLSTRRLVAAPILALALVPFALNFAHANRSNDYAARDWAYNMLMSVEPYGVLFTNGDNDTFPLWYLQEVEGIRRDVTVIVMSYLNTAWYAQQIRQLTAPCPEGVNPLDDPTVITCQRPYQPELGAGLYAPDGAFGDKGGEALTDLAPEEGYTVPTRSILDMSAAQVDSIPAMYNANPYNFYLENSLRVQAGDLTFTVPGQRVLLPADVFLLRIIQAARGDRPIYFATTTQAYDRVGLRDKLLRQGVALKLVGDIQPDAERGIYAMPAQYQIGGAFVDLPRTDTLLWNTFVHRGGIPDEWEFWPEPSTKNIPMYYAYAHFAAAVAHELKGEAEEAARHVERYEAWIRLGPNLR